MKQLCTRDIDSLDANLFAVWTTHVLFFLVLFPQWIDCVVDEIHAPCAATGQESGWSVAEDMGTECDFSFNYMRTKYIGAQGIPISVSLHQQPLTNDPNDSKTMKTAESITESHETLFTIMKVNQTDIDKHFKGLHGDGQIKKFEIASKVQTKYNIMTLFSKLQDLAHMLENIFDKVKYMLC